LKIIDRLRELDKIHPKTAAGQTDFWKACHRDFPQLNRKRMGKC
jgi:hypothetical protein